MSAHSSSQKPTRQVHLNTHTNFGYMCGCIIAWVCYVTASWTADRPAAHWSGLFSCSNSRWRRQGWFVESKHEAGFGTDGKGCRSYYSHQGPCHVFMAQIMLQCYYGFSLHVRTLCLYYVGQYLPGVSISKIGAWKLRSKVIAAFAVVDEHLPSLSGHW